MDSLMPGSRVAEAMAAIDSIDLSKVMRKLRLDEGWSEAQAATAEQRYRRFLCLRSLDAGFPLVPAKDIDKVWHQHILHTRDYARDCQRLFGMFLHHHPDSSEDGEARDRLSADFDRTRTLYRELFGEDYAATWLTYFLS